MAKYTLDTDFKTLSINQTKKWICEFCQMTEEAFKKQDTKSRLLAHILLLEAYTNTIAQGLKEHNRQLFTLIKKGLDFLLDYMNDVIKPTEFQEFAENLYSCVLEHNTGEEIQECQQNFYQKHFVNIDMSTDEWLILEWIGVLLLELVVIEGGELDLDFYEEFEDVENIDLFYTMEDMLNGLAESCANILGIDNYEQVYQAELFQNIIIFVCNTLKTALTATVNQYMALCEEYHQKTIVPKEYVERIIVF